MAAISVGPPCRSARWADSEKHLSLPAHDPGLADSFLDFAERINPTDLRPQDSLTYECRDFAEQEEG